MNLFLFIPFVMEMEELQDYGIQHYYLNGNQSLNIFHLKVKIEKFQDDYYSVVAKCHVLGESTLFIEFMLSQIDKILDDISKQVNEDIEQIDPNIKKLLDVMEDDVSYSSNELMQKLNLKAKEGFRRNYLRPAIDQNLIYMTIPDKPKSKNQRYIKV